MMTRLIAFVRGLARRRRMELELDEELRDHIERETAANVARGLSLSEARRVALRDLGGLTQITERVRTVRATWLDGAWRDLRYAARRVRRAPGFTLTTVATLTIGIGASTAIFTIGDQVLLRPLPYPDAARIVSIEYGRLRFQTTPEWTLRPAEVYSLPAFSALGLYLTGGVNLSGPTEPVRARAAGVDGGFFRVLDVAPILGRVLNDTDSGEGGRAAVVGFNVWRTEFGADASIVGRDIQINSRPFTVVGVMPRDFSFPERTDVWLPAAADAQMYGAAFMPRVIARLAMGHSPVQASQALASLEPPRNEPLPAPRVQPLQRELAARIQPTVVLLAALVTLLLVATCANVAGLLLAKHAGRTRELQVRQALGASRGRLTQQLAIESMVYAVAGGIAGAVAAVWTLQGFTAMSPALSLGMNPPALDVRLLGITLAVTTMATLVFSIAPIAATGQRVPAAMLREAATPGRRTSTVAAALIVAQVMLSVMLLAATSAALREWQRLVQIDLGFRGNDAVVFEVTPPRATYGSSASVARFADDLEARIRPLPGVSHVGLTSVPPMYDGMGVAARLALSGTVAVERHVGNLQSATSDYFRAMGIPLLAGRLFTPADGATSTPVVVLSEGAARAITTAPEELIGKRLAELLDGSEPEIVGIVGDAWTQRVPREPNVPNEIVYRPVSQLSPVGTLGVVLGVTGDWRGVIASVRSVLRQIDPALPIYNVVPVSELRSRFLATERLAVAVSATFSLVSLALAIVGIHGLLAQLVSQRTREIGIRMALGADRGRINAAIVLSGLRLTLLGVTAGLVAVAVGWRAIAAWLPQVDRPSIGMQGLNACVLVVVTVIAAWAPARRASSVDPVTVLKSE